MRAADGSVVILRPSGDYRGIRFVRVELSGLNLMGCDLAQVTFDDCVLEDVQFAMASLEGATFDRCYLQGVNFHNCDMTRARIIDSEVMTCYFTSTKMSRTLWKGADIEHTSFVNCNWRVARFDDVRFVGCDEHFMGSLFTNVQMYGVSMYGYSLSNVGIHGSNLVNCRIATVGIVMLRLTKTHVNDSTISLVTNDSAFVRVTECTFNRSSLSDFRLGHSTIVESRFKECLVNNVDCENTTIAKCDFTQTIVIE